MLTSALRMGRVLSNLLPGLRSGRKGSDLENSLSKNSCYLHTLYFSKECHLTINAMLNKGNVRNVSLVGRALFPTCHVLIGICVNSRALLVRQLEIIIVNTVS